jgi:hypothetical protein
VSFIEFIDGFLIVILELRHFLLHLFELSLKFVSEVFDGFFVVIGSFSKCFLFFDYVIVDVLKFLYFFFEGFDGFF